MLLVVDMGNTNITLGVFKDEQLLKIFRLTTKMAYLDEYGIMICSLLESIGVKPGVWRTRLLHPLYQMSCIPL